MGEYQKSCWWKSFLRSDGPNYGGGLDAMDPSMAFARIEVMLMTEDKYFCLGRGSH